MSNNAVTPTFSTKRTLFKNFGYYSAWWLIWGALGGLVSFVTFEYAKDHFWLVKAQQVAWGLLFGLTCCIVFTICQNLWNHKRKKSLSWTFAIVVWMGLKFAWVAAMGTY